MRSTLDIQFDRETEKVERINEDLILISEKDGISFGTDSFFLAAFAKPRRKGSAAELGAGTGVVSLLCAAKNKYSKIYSVEIDENCSDIAERNAENNGLSGVIEVLNADVRKIGAEDVGGHVDAVFFNPPYLKDGHGKKCDSPGLERARREHSGGIADFCAASGRLLKYGGTMTVVWRPERLCDLFSAMRESKIEPKKIVPVYAFADCAPSLVLVEGKAGASASLEWSRPLVIYEKRGSAEYTADARKIYDEFSLDHLFGKPRGRER